MRVYLAARYRRRPELQRRAEEFSALGHHVTSRWIRGSHNVSGGLDDPLWAKFAQEDFEDVAAARPMGSSASWSPAAVAGRHVEFGIALAWGKRTIVVGEPEHLFHTLPSVEAYPTWPQALNALR